MLFGDVRDGSWELCDGRRFGVRPDMTMDYRDLPFPDGTFRMVVLDPPLRLTPYRPLFGNRQPKRAGTHWIVYMKDEHE